MDSFVIRSGVSDQASRHHDTGDTGSQELNSSGEVSQKLAKLRSLDLKAVKLAITHELKTQKSQPILALQEETSATKSQCWKYFSHVIEKESGVRFTANERHYVACRACLRTYAFNSVKGTTTLIAHTKQCSITEANAGAGSMVEFTTSSVPAKEKRRVCRAAAIMRCKDLRSFSFCEGDGFKELARALVEIGAKLGSSVDIDELLPVGNTIKNHVVKSARDARTRLQNILIANFMSGCSAGFTVDLWTDKVRKQTFASVTVHFIDEHFKLHARTLQVKHFESKTHSATAVLEFFNDCLRSYQIFDRRLFTVVADSTQNINDRGL